MNPSDPHSDLGFSEFVSIAQSQIKRKIKNEFCTLVNCGVSAVLVISSEELWMNVCWLAKCLLALWHRPNASKTAPVGQSLTLSACDRPVTRSDLAAEESHTILQCVCEPGRFAILGSKMYIFINSGLVRLKEKKVCENFFLNLRTHVLDLRNSESKSRIRVHDLCWILQNGFWYFLGFPNEMPSLHGLSNTQWVILYEYSPEHQLCSNAWHQ